MSVRGLACAYCGKPSHHGDHVIPRTLRRAALRPIPEELAGVVPSCRDCNWLKLSRCLVPASWEDKIPALTELFPWKTWRVWRGDVREQAYVEAVA